MNFRPLVSLVCPTYGRPQLIPFAVQFFLSQTWTRSELIIIDDSPRDLQCKIRESGRIRVVRLKDRLSLGEKHNLGHDLAQGDILGYQDDDDIWGHHRLARQLQPIVLGECSIVG
ncbi:MAG: glycosyltransferase family 2 protein, partial [Vicinamibacteria bacterium]